MPPILKDIEAQALELSPMERGSLIHSLIQSLDGPAEEPPEEIARRVADMEAGRTKWIPAEEVFARLDGIAKGKR